MNNAKKEFTRHEVQSYANWWKGVGGPHSHTAKIAEMLDSFAARLAEDEASKPVWVNGEQLKLIGSFGGDHISEYANFQSKRYDTPLYARRKK